MVKTHHHQLKERSREMIGIHLPIEKEKLHSEFLKKITKFV
mgnify:CR=1 FL=1